MRWSSLAIVLAACAPAQVELIVPRDAETLVLARAPDTAIVIDLADRALAGSLTDEALIAAFYRETPAALGVMPGPLDDRHRSFPAPIGLVAIEDGASVPITSVPAWLLDLVDPPCPPMASAPIATATSSVELYGAIDGRRALARINRRLFTIDIDGQQEPASSEPVPRFPEAHTDGARIWMFGGDTGAVFAGNIDPEGTLTPQGPPGYPMEAGPVRHVDGGRDPRGPADIVAVTDTGWALRYDGERWAVIFEPEVAVTEREAKIAWLGPGHTVLSPGVLEGTRIVEVIGGSRTEIVAAELGADEHVSALAAGRNGDLLIAGDEGHVFVRPNDDVHAELLAKLDGEINALFDTETMLWTFGPLGVQRIAHRGEVVCPLIDRTSIRGRASIAVLATGVIYADFDVIYALR